MPDSEREWWLARHARKLDEHTCGHPREVCADPERIWYPQMSVCRVEMEAAAAQAQYDRLHEKRPWHDGTFTDWAAEPSADHPYHRDFGTRIWVTETDLGLGGNFTTRENPFEDNEEDARGNSS
jgi:hypothetical protein